MRVSGLRRSTGRRVTCDLARRVILMSKKSKRPELRALVFEWADNRCEHPISDVVDEFPDGAAVLWFHRCGVRAEELSHIYPRGMGHTGYRDTIDNVIAACTLHARSTDDLSSPEWQHVPAPHDRKALKEWIAASRADWAIDMEEQ